MHEKKRLEIKMNTSVCMDKNNSMSSSMCRRNAPDIWQVASDLENSEDATKLKTCLPGEIHCSLLLYFKELFHVLSWTAENAHLVMSYNCQKCSFQSHYSITLKGNF
jgi:hypothetical protein